jgi:hydrocephalus-inducing protein
VKGIGYILSHTVFFQGIPTPLDPHASHPINMGDIYINEKRSKVIEIENKGDFNFDFSMKKNSNLSFI